MFTIELSWAEDVPDDTRHCTLPHIEVPALPPEGTVIHLTRSRDYGIFGRTVAEFYEVEVVEAPILYVTEPGKPGEYVVEVSPVD